MTTDMVTIPKEEYNRLKTLEKVEWEVVVEFKQALEYLKAGNVKEC
jgi:hypothetical protein